MASPVVLARFRVVRSFMYIDLFVGFFYVCFYVKDSRFVEVGTFVDSHVKKCLLLSCS